MKIFLFISLLNVLFSPLNGGHPGLRIVGGKDAYAGEFPFAAAIYSTTSESTYFCGGAILSDQWISTSGNCVNEGVIFTLHLGSNELDDSGSNVARLSTDTGIVHPYFNPETLENDLGLIKLRLSISFTDYIQPIKLPSRDVQAYAVVSILGWGQTSDGPERDVELSSTPSEVIIENPGLSNHLQTVILTTLGNTECKIYYGNQITDNMVCVDGNYNEGTCMGDSGGPLIQYINGYQASVVGVSSFYSGNGCESTDPSGYTRVFPYLEWIKNVTRIASL